MLGRHRREWGTGNRGGRMIGMRMVGDYDDGITLFGVNGILDHTMTHTRLKLYGHSLACK